MAVHFIAVTLLGGRLFPWGLPHGWGIWDSRHLERGTEPEITPGLGPADRVVRTKEELEAALREPDGITPARTLWIREDLEDEVRRLWQRKMG
jgi:hypothetical protein